MTATDLLDSIKRARLRVTTAEADVRDAEAILRDRKKSLADARKKYDLAIEEALSEHRQPSLFDDAPADPEPLLAAARERVIEEQAQPSVPAEDVFASFASDELAAAVLMPDDPPAPRSWRTLTLAEIGWEENLLPDVWAAINGVPTAGELADKLLAGELFGLPLFDLESVYALVEMISEDDPAPIDFDAHFNPEPSPEDVAAAEQVLIDARAEVAAFEVGAAEPAPAPVASKPDPRRVPCVLCLAKAGDPCQTTAGKPRADFCTRRKIDAEQDRAAEASAVAVAEVKALAGTKLADLGNFPDAVADALAPGITTVETLLEELQGKPYIGAEMPLRNRVVAFLIGEYRDIKLKHAEYAADAVAKFVEPQSAPIGDGAIAPVNIGDVVRTSYGTGPYVVQKAERSAVHGKWHLTLADALPGNKPGGPSYLNGVVREPDGRITIGYGADELFLLPKGAPHGPEFFDWLREAGLVRERQNKDLQRAWARGEKAPEKVQPEVKTVDVLNLPKPKRDRKKKAPPKQVWSGSLDTWDGVPDVPADAVRYLASKGVHTLADLDAIVDRIRGYRGRGAADRYDALKELNVPAEVLYLTGDALVDWEAAKDTAGPAPESKPAKGKKKAGAK